MVTKREERSLYIYRWINKRIRKSVIKQEKENKLFIYLFNFKIIIKLKNKTLNEILNGVNGFGKSGGGSLQENESSQ